MMGAEQPGVVDGLKHRDYRQMLAFTEVQFLEVERASKIACKKVACWSPLCVVHAFHRLDLSLLQFGHDLVENLLFEPKLF